MNKHPQNHHAVAFKGMRSKTMIRLRWVAIIGQLLCLFLVSFGLKFQLPFTLCLSVIGLSIVMNIGLGLFASQLRWLNVTQATIFLIYDILQLSFLLYLTGGLTNPFAILLIAPITIAAKALPFGRAILLGLFTLVILTLLTHFHLPLPWIEGEAFHLSMIYQIGIWAAIVSTAAFMAVYGWRLSSESQQISQALTATEMILAREQTLSAIDGIAAAAAHGLGTPLSTISLAAKELEREIPSDSPYVEDIKLIRSQAIRCRELLQSLSFDAKQVDTIFNTSPIGQFLEELIHPHGALTETINIVMAPQPNMTPPFDREPVINRLPGLIYSLTNFIENAADFSSSLVTITAAWDEETIKLTILDDGPGFSKLILEELGAPFKTSRPQAKRGDGRLEQDTGGMGLGIFIATTLLQRCGANVSYKNRPGKTKGAQVEILWKRSDLDKSLN